MPVGTVPVSGPMTFSIGKTQYIAINAGWNSAIVAGLNSGPEPFSVGPARLIVFALDAKGVELPPAPPSIKIAPPPTDKQPRKRCWRAASSTPNCVEPAMVRTPRAAWWTCVISHRNSMRDSLDTVLKGTHKNKGHASFRDALSDDQANAIHSYLIKPGRRKTGNPYSGRHPSNAEVSETK